MKTCACLSLALKSCFLLTSCHLPYFLIQRMLSKRCKASIKSETTAGYCSWAELTRTDTKREERLRAAGAPLSSASTSLLRHAQTSGWDGSAASKSDKKRKRNEYFPDRFS